MIYKQTEVALFLHLILDYLV